MTSTGETPDDQAHDDQAQDDPGRRLHAVAVELAAMAQNGLTYGSDRYDLARYERLRSMSAEVMALLARTGPADFRAALAAEAGHATPKVDVRGALFDDGDGGGNGGNGGSSGKVLLVREGRDRRWTLPGGWADALDAPSEAAEREFLEEAGLRVRATKLAVVHDGSRRNGHAGSPWHTYKLFFLVERLDDARPTAGLDGETIDVGFFGLDELPELSTGRCTADQLAILFAHHREPGLATDFD